MPDQLPDPRQAEAFHFVSHQFDPASGTLRLNYRFDNGPILTETLTFPSQPWPQDPGRQRALTRAFELLHLVAGISYYKAGVPAQLRIDSCNPGAGGESFLSDLYSQGLAEFAWVNKLDLPPEPDFYTSQAGPAYVPPDLLLPRRILLAQGGGKDSLVSLEMLRSSDMEVTLACSGNSPLIAQTARVAGLPLLSIDRILAPELGQYNRQGAWNGHVPVTAINSAILVCAALLYGFDHVVFANERSASFGNLVDGQGRAVNHQYSKSLEFEKNFRAVVRDYISPQLNYFSLLRPWSELAIIGMFSKLTKYHGSFSSCNRNFHQDGSRIVGNWCGVCPKCMFAFLGLSVFLPAQDLCDIFGKDLLADEALTGGFAALCGLDQHKPFECVGEITEARAAVMRLRKLRPQSPVIKTLAKALAKEPEVDFESCLKPGNEHFIPPKLWEQICATA